MAFNAMQEVNGVVRKREMEWQDCEVHSRREQDNLPGGMVELRTEGYQEASHLKGGQSRQWVSKCPGLRLERVPYN